MRVIVISCVYPPEPVASAQMSAQLAQALYQEGDQVTVITDFPNRPGGRLYAGYNRRIYQREKYPECILIRCWGTLSQHSKLASRFLENLTFGITSACALSYIRHVDVVYANTWPLFAAGLITLVTWLRHIPLIVSVQDVYPESLVAQGRLHAGSLPARILRAIDCWIAHRSSVIVVISEGFANIYRKDRKLSGDRIFIIPNWGEEGAILETERENRIRAQHHFLPDDFIFGYGGNIGVAAGVEAIIQAMQKIDIGGIKLLVAGEGSQLATCKQLAQGGCNPNITFHSPWPVEETSIVLSAADVLILPTHRDQSGFSVPSKLINYMYSSRPILALANEDTDVAGIIRQAGCGWVLPPGNLEILSRQMIQISQEPKDRLLAFGRAGRIYALENFNKNRNLDQLKKVISLTVTG